jgi:peptidoglycan/xylan/chitin deacetylase (PgdA/CDA1 family)
MKTKDTVTLKQQRERRNRVNRMKTGIIVVIVVWMIVSLLAIIILSIEVAQLNSRLNAVVEAVSKRTDSGDQDRLTDESDTQLADDAEQADDAGQNAYANVVTGIDSPDNMAQEGDTHRVYLTFDGSPCTNTDSILDVLNDFGVKATFFVVGDDSDEAKAIYKRIVEEGHTLGMHSYSNKYSTIYASTDAFEEDLDKISSFLQEETGEQSLFYRFPGGSSNEISNVSMTEFVHILNEKGITFYDWNVSAGDAASNYSVDDIITNVTEGVSHYRTSVVLLHDGDNKSTTVEALGPLIEALEEMDAQILPIDENTNVIQYIKADSVG